MYFFLHLLTTENLHNIQYSVDASTNKSREHGAYIYGNIYDLSKTVSLRVYNIICIYTIYTRILGYK